METTSDAICVYGASSPDIPEIYLREARAAGRAIAFAGRSLVCGGGKSGVMAAAIEGAAMAGGTTVGILPQFMLDRQWQHPLLSEVVATPDMHRRKEEMARRSYGVIAFPGGCGTLEELLEIITWRQLGLFHGNVVIANIDGYYDPLLQMLDRTIRQHFMHPDHTSLWSIASTGTEAVELALRPTPRRTFTQKIR